MNNIVSFRGDEHDRAQLVMPWYATGRLDEAERAEVEAHLAICAECREDLAFERTLTARVASLSIGADPDWNEFRQRVRPRHQHRERRDAARAVRRWFGRPSKLGWFIAGQAVAAGLILAIGLPRQEPRAAYHTLGASPSHPPGNAVVLFRSDASEAQIRAALVASRARIVDGPTASGAYVLRVAAEQRGAILTELSARRSVILAQPIDADGPP